MAFKKIDRMFTCDNGDIAYEFDDKGYQIFYIQPANDLSSNLINYGFTGPMLLCFADEKLDLEGFDHFITTNGLKQIAAENGMGITLVNPKSADWNKEAAGAYEAVCDNLGIAQMNFHDGLAIMKDETRPDEQAYAILGSCIRMYVYAFGKGADYVAKHYLKKVKGQAVMGDLGMADQSMVCVTLKELSVLPEVQANDIRIVSINNSAEQNEILKKDCGEVLIRDDEDLIAQYHDYVGNFKRWVGRIMPADNYEKEGIIAKAESVMVPISADNDAFRHTLRFRKDPKHKIGYVTFYGRDLDLNNKNPLMLVFHGGGDCAYATASLAKWPQIAKENDFICVAVEMHMQVSAKEVSALIDHLSQEYKIDEERIYATGFSMGGIKSWDLYEQCPERFAALLPMDAIDDVGNNCFGRKTEKVNEDVMVPLFYVGGVSSPLPELPCQNERGISRLKYVAKVNQLKESFDLGFDKKDEWEDPYVGAKGDRTEVLHDELFPDSEYFAHYYNSRDGKCYTCLMAISNHQHEIREFTNRYAYEFARKFRRRNGKIEICE